MRKSDIAREWRAKPAYKDMPSLKLARIMFKKDNAAFTSVEDARSALRYIEGKAGAAKKARALKLSPTFVKEEARPLNPYNLPPSDEEDWKPFILKAKKVLILSDIHIPYHDVQALTTVFNFAKKEKPDAILLNGDTLDFYGLSKFARDPRKRHFAGELEMFKELIATMQKTFPYAKLYIKMGNHEERYEHYLWMKAGELVGVEEFELESIIKARANGITVITDKRIIKLNSLNVIHGHEFSSGFFSPVNVARGLYLRGKTSAIQGHNHATSEHTAKDMNDKITTTWSTGALCGMHPRYCPINAWNTGFCMVDLDGTTGYNVRNYRIMNGKIL